MDWVKEALFVAAVAYAYQEVTHQKILDNDHLKYGTMGFILGMAAGPKIEKYIKSEPNISKETKEKILGGAISAYLGYNLTPKVIGQAKKTFSGLEKKIKPQTE